MYRNFHGFGQVPPTCQDKAQALSDAQAAFAQASANQINDPNTFAQASQNQAQAQSDLQACVANPPPSTGQEIATGVQTGAAVGLPLLNVGLSLFGPKKAPMVVTGGVVPVTTSSNTTVIVAVAAVVIVALLAVVMMKK